jgi:hypothetical protein
MNLQRIVLLTFFRKKEKEKLLISLSAQPITWRPTPSVHLSLTRPAQVSPTLGYGPRPNRRSRPALSLSSSLLRLRTKVTAPAGPEFTAGDAPAKLDIPFDSPLRSALPGTLSPSSLGQRRARPQLQRLDSTEDSGVATGMALRWSDG